MRMDTFTEKKEFEAFGSASLHTLRFFAGFTRLCALLGQMEAGLRDEA